MNDHLKHTLQKTIDELNDTLPVVRDRVEDIIAVDNIVYIDSIIEKTMYLEETLRQFRSVLQNQVKHEDLVVISYDLDLIRTFVNFLDDTSIFLTQETKRK